MKFLLVVFCGVLAHPLHATSGQDAARETLLWLKEKESFSLKGCRTASKKDVRTEKNTRLEDVILKGDAAGRDANEEINLSHYIRLRLSETSSDSLGSRLARMGLSLLDVPLKGCQAWVETLKK